MAARLLLAIVLVATPTMAAPQAVGWLAAQSIERLEARAEEVATMAGLAGAQTMIQALIAQTLGALDGVDRTRPFGLAMVRYSRDRVPPMVLWVPYDDREAFERLVASRYPKAHTDAQGLVHLGTEGGLELVLAYDRVHRAARIAADPRFAGPIEGPDRLFDSPKPADVVATLDLAAYRTSDDPYHLRGGNLAAPFQALVEVADGQGRAILQAASTLVTDVASALVRDADGLRAAFVVTPAGAALDLTLRPRDRSTTDVFLRHQLKSHPHAISRLAAHRQRAEGLAMRVWWSVRPPDAERDRLLAVMRLVQDAILSRTDGLSRAERAVVRQARPMFRRQLERWSSGGAVSGGLDVLGTAQSPQVTLAYVMPQPRETLNDVLGYLARLDTAARGPPRLERDIGRHYGVAVHHRKAGPDGDPPVFLAAAGDVLAVHFGTASAPVTTYLDAFRPQYHHTARSRVVLARLEMHMAAAVRAGYTEADQQPAVTENPYLALMERPVVFELRAAHQDLTLRVGLPSDFFRAVGEAVRAGLEDGDARSSL